jgi:hypothetical protein
VTWVTCVAKLVLCGSVGIALVSERPRAGNHDGAAAGRRHPRICASTTASDSVVLGHSREEGRAPHRADSRCRADHRGKYRGKAATAAGLQDLPSEHAHAVTPTGTLVVPTISFRLLYGPLVLGVRGADARAMDSPAPMGNDSRKSTSEVVPFIARQSEGRFFSTTFSSLVWYRCLRPLKMRPTRWKSR